MPTNPENGESVNEITWNWCSEEDIADRTTLEIGLNSAVICVKDGISVISVISCQFFFYRTR